ncbi:two-component regulator propeller domain-containing protein [Maribacter sp. 2304DJ31-5]|uniref:hybrid sensor histidine kinase/response regulator transcription factor n=1 Tax=Maribacter sp. 2304DJ31-5 TaxID=3386273 RepID=UPI0039BCC617
MIRSIILTAVLGILIHNCCRGQSQPFFAKINRTIGLSNNRINSIVKEQEGFVWIGTKNGLNRYDGQSIKVYNEQNSNLITNDISDILIDLKGRMWVATLGGGLALYEPDKDNFTIYRNDKNDPYSIPSDKLNAIYEDTRGNLWIGTENGFCLFDRASNSFVSWLNGTPHNITSFLEHQENLWIGTFGDGLKKYDYNEQTLNTVESSKPHLNVDFIHALYELDDDTILLGTSGSGAVSLNSNTYELSNFLKEVGLESHEEINIVRSIIGDKKNNLWLGTDGNGMFEIQGFKGISPSITNYLNNPQTPSSLSGNAIYDLAMDNDGNVWIGTAWNGVNVFGGEDNFKILFSDIKGIDTSPVLSVFKTRDKLLMGLDGKGLTVFDSLNNKTTFYNKTSKIPIDAGYVQYIMKASNGTFWIGTFKNGLIHFDIEKGTLKQFKHRPNQNSLSYNDIRYIIEDENKNLWIASWEGGVSFFDIRTETFTHYKKTKDDRNSISSNNVIAMQKDGKYLWLATFGGGINLFDTEKKTFEHFRYDDENNNSISSDYVFSILKDSKGFIWIGTAGSGVNRYNPQKNIIERFDDQEIIKYATIVSIIEDATGKIWFGTKDGIYNFDYNTGYFNGVPNLLDEFHINSISKDSSGKLYFGGLQGVVNFDSNEVSHKKSPPKILFTDFKLFNKPVTIGDNDILQKNIQYQDSIILKHNLDVITFEFAALQYPFSSKREYAIKMENFDEDWRNIGKERTATYTNLPNGNYTFKVKSREKGMEWNSNLAIIDIEILKPLWFQWWAYLIYGFLSLALLFFLRKYTIAWERMKANLKFEQLTNEKNEELYNLKQRFFVNISHEIRTPLTLITGALNGLKKDAVDISEQKRLVSVRSNAKRLMDLVDELLNFRKLESGTIDLKITENNLTSFIREIYLAFGQRAIDNEIDYQFTSSSNDITLWFDKGQMEKTIFNIISNAFKFTPPGKSIKVEVGILKKQAIVRIIDTGEGIPKKKLSKIFNRFYQNAVTEKTGFGIGLSIAQEVIKLHSGKITVKSIEGKGSEFNILLPFGNDHFSAEHMQINEPQETFKKETPQNQLNKAFTSSNNTSMETILIIEDHDELRQYIKQVLNTSYNILEARNGKEGLKITLEQMPDLIVSDIMMPKMDGMQLCESIKTDMRLSHVPIILLTAKTFDSDKLKGFELGADDYITKPFNEPLLLARVKSLLYNRELLRKKFSADGLILPKELAINRKDQDFLKKLIKLIENNLDSPELNANYLSNEMGMSHSVLYKKIKALSGMNLVAFIRDYKFKIAKKLLEEQQYTVAEICYKIGYSDRKYFSKLFKQRFGQNPSEILKEQKDL